MMRRSLCLLVLLLAWVLSAPSAAADSDGSSGAPAKPLQLYFLNVGQGDAMLVAMPDRITALVDGGDPNRGEPLVAWLRTQGIETVDWIMPSHPHTDHIGGLNAVLEQMPIGGALLSAQQHTAPAHLRQLQLLAEKGIPVIQAQEGVVIELGAHVTATVLNPPPELLATREPVEDNSVVLRICLMVVCVLTTGDVGDERVNVADQARAMGRSQLAPDVGAGLHDRIGQEVGRDLLQELAQLGSVLRQVESALEVLDRLAVDQDAGGGLLVGDPRAHQVNGGLAFIDVGDQEGSIKELPLHSS